MRINADMHVWVFNKGLRADTWPKIEHDFNVLNFFTDGVESFKSWDVTYNSSIIRPCHSLEHLFGKRRKAVRNGSTVSKN